MAGCAHSVAAPAARSCARAVTARRGSSCPAALALLWPLKLSAPGVLKSAVGPAPTFTDTPTLSAGGVIPGDLRSVQAWSKVATAKEIEKVK